MSNESRQGFGGQQIFEKIQSTVGIDHKQHRLTVIIPTKNRPVDLELTVRSLLVQTVLPKQLIIVDQSVDAESQQGVQALLVSLPTGMNNRLALSYELDPAISGGAMARNRALKVASGDVWLFLDDDVILEPDFIEELLTVYSWHPEAWGISGIVTNYSRPSWLSYLWSTIFLRGPFHDERQRVYWRATPLRKTDPIRVDRLGGGLMSFRADMIRGHQFDESLQGVSDGEDVDFCVRLGPDAVLMIAPRARLEHKQSSAGRFQGHYLQRLVRSQYYLYWKNWDQGVRNRLCFAWLNAGVALLATIGSLRRGSLEPWRALRDGMRDAKPILPGNSDPKLNHV